MASKAIKQIMKKHGANVQDMANLFGLAYQTMANKLARDTWKNEDLIKIAQYFGYSIAFIKDNEQIIID